MTNRDSFENYYLNSTRVGTRDDVENFVRVFIKLTGSFNSGFPASSKLPEVLKKVKTRLLSIGMSSASATRVINSFKKWYEDQ